MCGNRGHPRPDDPGFRTIAVGGCAGWAATRLDGVARLLVVVPSETDPPARLGEWLRDAGLALDERHLLAGNDLPATLDGHDGLVVLGGPQSAMDSAETSPELVGVRALLGQALAADLPTLAICLGAQLLADVGGGRVRAGIDGPEVGATLVAKRDAADRDPVFGPLPLSPDVLQWHHDEISELPTGAELLASNPHYTNQAYRVGRHVYGLQFHIETTPEIIRAWAESDPVGVAAGPHDLETICARSTAAHPDIEEAWAPFAGRFAELVRTGGRRAACPSWRGHAETQHGRSRGRRARARGPRDDLRGRGPAAGGRPAGPVRVGGRRRCRAAAVGSGAGPLGPRAQRAGRPRGRAGRRRPRPHR